MSSVSLCREDPGGPVGVLCIFIDGHVGLNLTFLAKAHTLQGLVHRVAQLEDGRTFKRQVLVGS